MTWKSYLSLKYWVIASVVILWNAALLLSLGGRFGQQSDLTSQFPISGSYILPITCFILGIFSLCVSVSERFRNLVVSEKRKSLYSMPEYVLATVIFFLMGGIVLFGYF